MICCSSLVIQSGGLHYKGSEFHRVVPGQCVHGGKLGAAASSAFGGLFADESFELGHARGVLSMANSGANKNGSQFFVCLKRMAAWDGKHVVFGRVLSGLKVCVTVPLCVWLGVGCCSVF